MNLQVIVLNDVLFGDVWVCSGQSNMEWTMGKIFNATEEIARMADYPNVRMFRLAHKTSDTPQDDIMDESPGDWSKTDDANAVSAFSAVCLLTATYMADALGKDTVSFINNANIRTIDFVFGIILRHLD